MKRKFKEEVIDTISAVVSSTGKVHMGMDGNHFTVCGYEVDFNHGWSEADSPGRILCTCQRCNGNAKGY